MLQVKYLISLLILFVLVVESREEEKEIKLNCEEATQEKCENSLRWEQQCPKQCDPYPNACHSCRDKMYKCDDLTKESPECEDWHMKALCLKTCGVCECDRGHEEL